MDRDYVQYIGQLTIPDNEEAMVNILRQCQRGTESYAGYADSMMESDDANTIKLEAEEDPSS